MKIIQPSVELIDIINPADILAKIERCGRVSHQSESKGNPEGFIQNIIMLGHESVLEHVSLTFHIICDRAIQNELVRHRHASFTVESTRYVKYNNIEVIAPDFGELQSTPDTRYEMIFNDENEVVFQQYPDTFQAWKMAVEGAENIYRFLITQGATPEQARAVLPLCLKSELYMTANLREWRHILKLRTDKAAHPQMRFIAGRILAILREKLPVIVEDIGGD